jgi:homoserine/homoserine lactone efflux protein
MRLAIVAQRGRACQAGADAHYRFMFFSIMAWDRLLLFIAALVPQFLDTARPLALQYILMFVITFIGESTILTGYGWLAAAGGRAAASHAVWRERISGAVLIGLGAMFAVARL